jgi:hypothetical protein
MRAANEPHFAVVPPAMHLADDGSKVEPRAALAEREHRPRAR